MPGSRKHPETRFVFGKTVPASRLWDKNITQITVAPNHLNPLVRVKFVGKASSPKGLIVTQDSYIGKHWIFYPKKKHIPAFGRASNYVRGGGPAQINRGSVGSVVTREKKNSYKIVYMQAHFKVSSQGAVNRSLASKYGGWLRSTLQPIFEHAETKNSSVMFRKSLFINPARRKSQKRKIGVFREVAESIGFRVKETLLSVSASKT